MLPGIFSFLKRLGFFSILVLSLVALSCSGAPEKAAQSGSGASAGEGVDRLSVEELAAMPKIDAHTHISGLALEEEAPFFAKLAEHNMKWLTICTRGMNWPRMQKMTDLAERLHPLYPEQVAWAASFNLSNWGHPDWEQAALQTLRSGFEQGAVAVKVWKEIGMELKDPDSSYVMIDDPRFDPLFDFIESRGKTLVAHIGEPRNCWLPLDSMTVNNDRKYFAENPKYHACLHPEIPHYWKQIAARDNVLKKHPGLRVVGCHLGSLEFDVDTLARRLDEYPNFAVDMAARICHFQVQDREKVRNFMLKYQDRLLYGTDLAISAGSPKGASLEETLKTIEETYRKDYRYFATDEEMSVWEVNGPFRGLDLPKETLKKMFYENAEKWYPGI